VEKREGVTTLGLAMAPRYRAFAHVVRSSVLVVALRRLKPDLVSSGTRRRAARLHRGRLSVCPLSSSITYGGLRFETTVVYEAPDPDLNRNLASWCAPRVIARRSLRRRLRWRQGARRWRRPSSRRTALMVST